MWTRLFSTALIPVSLLLFLNTRIMVDLCNSKVRLNDCFSHTKILSSFFHTGPALWLSPEAEEGDQPVLPAAVHCVGGFSHTQKKKIAMLVFFPRSF